MADTKYLQRRGNCWYVRIPKPPRLWGASGEFVCSLNTPDLKVARRLRDKYLMPILAETSATGMVAAIARLAAAGNETIARQLSEVRSNLSGQDSGLTLRRGGSAFIRYLAASRSYAPATLQKYSASIEGACQLLGEDTALEGLAKAEAIRLRDTLLSLPIAWQLRKGPLEPARQGQRQLSAKAVSNYLNDLRRMFRWLLQEGRLMRSDNPFEGVKVARVRAVHKRAPTVEEADVLMNLPRPNAIDPDTWGMMPVLARYTGCRAGELAQLRVEDVVVEQEVRCFRITARGEGRQLKTISSERLVPVADKLADRLDELLAKRGSGLLAIVPIVATVVVLQDLGLFCMLYGRESKDRGVSVQ